MSILSDLAVRARWLLHRRREEREMREELNFHLEMETERHRRGGLSSEEARRAARLAFGGEARIEEETREAHGAWLLDDVGRDLRHAGRVLRRHPAYAIATVLTFALGIGVATAIFSIVYGVVFRPLPYRDPNRLVVLWERDVVRGKDRNVVAVPNFEAWRARGRSFERMAALVPAPMTIGGGRSVEHTTGAEVSPGYFAMLGVTPALGREFTDAEGLGRAADVVILSDQLWRTRYGGDPGVLRRTMSLDGRPFTIVGVMPPDFDPPRFAWLHDQSFWIPFAPTVDNRRWGRYLLVVARLGPEVSVEQAGREIASIADARAREDPADRGWSASLVPLTRQLTGDARPALLLLLGAALLLLLIALTNVAMLTLGHTRRRTHELSLRRALGASRGRLVRQLLAQSAVLGAVGAAVGLGAAWAGTRVLLALLPPELPRAGDIRLDGPVLALATMVAVLATFVFGIAGARRGTSDVVELGISARITSGRQGGAIVVAELALGVMLAAAAGLMIRSFGALRAVDLGFRAEQVVVARVELDGAPYRESDRRRLFWDELLTRLRGTPGVSAAGAISTRPFGGMAPATSVSDAARPFPPGREPPIADIRWVDSTFFRVLRVPFVQGSGFARSALEAQPMTAVISEATARALWPGQRAVTRRVSLQLNGGTVAEVVGVVADVHLMDARTDIRPTVYLPVDARPAEALDILVRGSVAPAALVRAIRGTVAQLDPGVPVFDVATMSGIVDRSIARDRFTMLLLDAFAATALLLASVGIYGVHAAEVAHRRRELAIRQALGADGREVLALLMRGGAKRAALGIAIGIAGALLLSRMMAVLLFGVSPADPLAFAAVALLMFLVAILATMIPAVRAARIAPSEAMRVE